jgi:hypothetical protein
MCEQQLERKIPYATISLFLSGLSLLAFVLVLVFGYRLATFLTCMQHLRFPSESWMVGVIGLTPIYLPSLLAIALSFAETMSGARKRVLVARIISLALFCLYLAMGYWLFLTLYWVDAPVSC